MSWRYSYQYFNQIIFIIINELYTCFIKARVFISDISDKERYSL